jgi:hypothetical protein
MTTPRESTSRISTTSAISTPNKPIQEKTEAFENIETIPIVDESIPLKKSIPKQFGKSKLTDDEKYTIRNMIHVHHECEDSVNNTANYIMSYLVESRQFMNDIKENE